MLIYTFLVNILCAQSFEDGYLPEIWEVEKDRASQPSNEYGITPNIVRKSKERLDVLTQRKRMELMQSGLIKSKSSKSLSTPRHYYSTEYDQVLDNKEGGLSKSQFRIYSYPEDLRKLADYDPEYLFRYENSGFGSNRVLSKDVDTDTEKNDQKFRIKLDLKDGKSVLNLDKLDGCTKKSRRVFKRISSNKKGSCKSTIPEERNNKFVSSDVSFSDWLTNVFYKNKKTKSKEDLLQDTNKSSEDLFNKKTKSKEDLLQDTNKSSEDLFNKKTKSNEDLLQDTNKSSEDLFTNEITLKSIIREKISSDTKETEKNEAVSKEDPLRKKPIPRRRTIYYKPDINPIPEQSEEKDTTKDIEKTNEGIENVKKENTEYLDSFTFHYIPNTIKKIVSDEDLSRYKLCFFHACSMFNTHKHIFISFKNLVITYKKFINTYFPGTSENTYTVERLRRKVGILLESRSNKIKYMLLKLNEFENTEIVFRRLHKDEEKIHLNSKIIQYIKECTKDEKDYEFNDVMFLTCIRDIAYEITYLDMAFYILAKYCSINFE
jgi:hypothetical protein